MPTPREVARRAVLDALTTEARRQLARDGAAGLSLRSIARELDMVSSGIYRYVASRDDLLTLLIVEGYGRLATALREAAGDADGRDRWTATCRALRRWALAHPQEYALLYGSPVPGYAAPEDTIPAATAVYVELAAPLEGVDGPGPAVTGALAADGARVGPSLGLDLDASRAIALLGAWATLFGLVSLELFGHTTNVVTDHEAFFDHQVEALADQLGL